MGLDMYLSRAKKIDGATPTEVSLIENYLEWKDNPRAEGYTLKEWCGTDEEDVNMELVYKYTELFTEKYFTWDKERMHPYKMLKDPVGYWRKANQIHTWFVNNVQDGNDDCGEYEVSRQKLKALLNLCQIIKEESTLIDGTVNNGYKFTPEGGEVAITEPGQIIINPEVAKELLPTSSGFFFGSTDYDQWYMQDIEETIEILTDVLATTDFDTEMVMYSSSW